jgi:hypothetical protein
MKKIIIAFLMVMSIHGYSQITLDFQSQVPNMRTVKLSNTLTKYTRDFNDAELITQFTLYNLDGSIYKTIYLPPKPYDTSFVYYISNITNSLFDTDTTNIEYLTQLIQ